MQEGRNESSSTHAQALFHSLRSAYPATPTSLKVLLFLFIFLFTHSEENASCWLLIYFGMQIIDLYFGFAVFTALIQVSFLMTLFFHFIDHFSSVLMVYVDVYEIINFYMLY